MLKTEILDFEVFKGFMCKKIFKK